MKKLLLFAILAQGLCSAQTMLVIVSGAGSGGGGGGGTITPIQHSKGSNATGAAVVTSTAADYTGSNFIIINCPWGTGGTLAAIPVYDSSLNTWHPLTYHQDGTASDSMFYCISCTTSASQTFSCDTTPSNGYPTIQ